MKLTRVWVWLGVACLLGGVYLEAQDASPQTTPSGEAASAASAGAGTVVPRLVQFSGVIKDAAGKPATGTVAATFSLYELQEGGTPLWVETQNLQLDGQGRYTVLLGATQPEGLPLDLFTTGKARWLGVQPQLPGTGEQPRVLLVGVPYAMKAADADTLGGKPPSAYALSDGQIAASATSTVEGRTAGASGGPISGAQKAGVPTTGKSASQPSSVGGGGIPNFIPIWTNSTTLGNSVLFQTGFNLGLGTITPGAKLDSIGEGIAVRGKSLGPGGTGVVGIAKAGTGVNYGVSGFTNSTTNGAAGVNGHEGAATGQVYGVSGSTPSPTNGAAGVNGHEGATTGIVFGVAGSTPSTTDGAAGVQGHEGATTGMVFGVAGSTPSTTNGAAGVNGHEGAASGLVYGVAGSTNSTGPYATGVSGYAGATTGQVFGVTGYTTSTGTGAAGVQGGATATTGQVDGVTGFTDSTTNGAAGVRGSANGTTGSTSGVFGSNNSTSTNAFGVSGYEGATTGQVYAVNGYTQSTGPGAAGVNGVESATTGQVYGVNGGTNSTTNGAAAVNGYEGATSGAVFGVNGGTNSTTNGAASVNGYEGATTGQVYGVSGGTNSTTNGAAAVNGYEGASSGAVYGVNGGTNSTTFGAAGVNGNAGGTTGFVNGVSGTSASPNGDGVWGGNTATTGGVGVQGVGLATSGPNIGVQGISDSAQGIGVQALSANVAVAGLNEACTSTGCTPVKGTAGQFVTAAGGTVLQGIGGSTTVFTVDASGNGSFAGNLNVTGKLTKGSGSFKIDHPLDPATKYLYHSFVESPDMMDVYNGVVRLDAKGQAWVSLPDYFEALNRDFRYQLTCIGGFAPVYIAREVHNNRFQIAGGKAGGKVSWQVTGIRHDPYAEANRIPVTEDKPPGEQGYYLHPEVYGQNESMRVGAGRPAGQSPANAAVPGAVAAGPR